MPWSNVPAARIAIAIFHSRVRMNVSSIDKGANPTLDPGPTVQRQYTSEKPPC